MFWKDGDMDGKMEAVGDFYEFMFLIVKQK